jgi:hypothetical protein
MMEQHQHNQVEDRLHRLAYSGAPGEFADGLYAEVEGLLAIGYSRETLYEYLKHLALDLRRNGRDDLEDDVLDVANALVGWCAPSAQL